MSKQVEHEVVDLIDDDEDDTAVQSSSSTSGKSNTAQNGTPSSSASTHAPERDVIDIDDSDDEHDNQPATSASSSSSSQNNTTTTSTKRNTGRGNKRRSRKRSSTAVTSSASTSASATTTSATSTTSSSSSSDSKKAKFADSSTALKRIQKEFASLRNEYKAVIEAFDKEKEKEKSNDNTTTKKQTRKQTSAANSSITNSINIIACPTDENTSWYEWIARIKGPQDSPFENGYFYLDIKFPDNYPFNPPHLKFSNKVWHPNVQVDGGHICLDILQNQWSPSLTLPKVLLSISSLFTDPNPDSPLNSTAAYEIKQGKNKYATAVKKHIKTNAKWNKEKEAIFEKMLQKQT